MIFAIFATYKLLDFEHFYTAIDFFATLLHSVLFFLCVYVEAIHTQKKEPKLKRIHFDLLVLKFEYTVNSIITLIIHLHVIIICVTDLYAHGRNIIHI